MIIPHFKKISPIKMVGKDKKGLMNEVKVDKGYFVKELLPWLC